MIIKIIQIILISLLLTSCNKKDKTSKEAISVFSTNFSPKIDPRLTKKEIKLPKQIENTNFNIRIRTDGQPDNAISISFSFKRGGDNKQL